MHPSYDSSFIFICSYPKSGTNWLIYILHNLLNETSDYGLNISQYVPFIKDPDATPSSSFYETKEKLRWCHRVPSTFSKQNKKVYIVRNPIDVLHSANKWFWYPGLPENRSSKDYLQDFMNHETFGPWYEHVKSAVDNKDENTLLISYESLKDNFEATLLEIAKFFDKYISLERIQEIKDICSFENMSKEGDKLTNRIQFSNLLFRKPGELFRVGKANNYTQEDFLDYLAPLKPWYDYYKSLKENKVIL